MIAAVSIVEWGPWVFVGFGALAYGIRVILDMTGRSRSSQILREENTDLLRIKAELEARVVKLEASDARKDAEIAHLVEQVEEFKKRDQAAVISLLEDHERQAGVRHDTTVTALREIRDAVLRTT